MTRIVPLAPICLTLALATLALAVATPATAQERNPAAVAAPGAPGTKAQGAIGQRNIQPPPPALPGARAEPTAVAPATKQATDMPPTEALFDAINRGDMLVAKDSVNRGADLNGTNILGLTPIELAVDLGRNEISFYLLSLRGGSSGTSSRGPLPEAKPPTRAERQAADLAAAQANRTARSRNAVANATPAPPSTARLFVGDGGAPIPQAGFLGFNGGR